MFQQPQATPNTYTQTSFFNQNPSNLQMSFGQNQNPQQNQMMPNQNPQLFAGQNPMTQQQNFTIPMQQQIPNQMNTQYNPTLGNTSLKAYTTTQNQENELQIVFNNFLNAIK